MLKNPPYDSDFLKVVRFCWKFALWVIWWCWIHFWCCFHLKKFSWPPLGVGWPHPLALFWSKMFLKLSSDSELHQSVVNVYVYMPEIIEILILFSYFLPIIFISVFWSFVFSRKWGTIARRACSKSGHRILLVFAIETRFLVLKKWRKKFCLEKSENWLFGPFLVKNWPF